MSISSSSVHFFECSLSCRLDLLDWMSFLSPFVDWSALASSLNRLRVTSRSAGHQDGAWAQRSGQCYSFFAFWSLRRPAVWFFVAEGLFLLFWWIRVLFPPLNRIMWLLEPKGIRRGVLFRLKLVHFFLFLNGQRLVRCVRGLRSTFRFFWCGFYSNAAIKGWLVCKGLSPTDSMTDWLDDWLTDSMTNLLTQ